MPTFRPSESASASFSPVKNPDQPRGAANRLQYAWSDEKFKLLSLDDGQSWALCDLQEDPGETRDLSQDLPELVAKMKSELFRWVNSCAQAKGRHPVAGKKHG